MKKLKGKWLQRAANKAGINIKKYAVTLAEKHKGDRYAIAESMGIDQGDADAIAKIVANLKYHGAVISYDAKNPPKYEMAAVAKQRGYESAKDLYRELSIRYDGDIRKIADNLGVEKTASKLKGLRTRMFNAGIPYRRNDGSWAAPKVAKKAEPQRLGVASAGLAAPEFDPNFGRSPCLRCKIYKCHPVGADKPDCLDCDARCGYAMQMAGVPAPGDSFAVTGYSSHTGTGQPGRS